MGFLTRRRAFFRLLKRSSTTTSLRHWQVPLRHCSDTNGAMEVAVLEPWLPRCATSEPRRVACTEMGREFVKGGVYRMSTVSGTAGLGWYAGVWVEEL